MATTKDGYTLVNENTTAILDQTQNVRFYRLCTAYTYNQFVLRYLVSGSDFSETFKTEEEGRAFFKTLK
jgi:hypothetical protein